MSLILITTKVKVFGICNTVRFIMISGFYVYDYDFLISGLVDVIT
jgi:hypothetical protein